MPDDPIELLLGFTLRSSESVDGDAIVVERLEKRYANGTEAVRGISFRVGAGEVFGLLGPNGAGKSTTMGILGTLVRPTSGRAIVAAHDVAKAPHLVRRRTGFAMQEVGVDGLAAGGELVVLHARLHGLSRREAARRAALFLELVGIGDAARRRMSEYSGGMRRRVDLASALVHLPSVHAAHADPVVAHGDDVLLESLHETGRRFGRAPEPD